MDHRADTGLGSQSKQNKTGHGHHDVFSMQRYRWRTGSHFPGGLDSACEGHGTLGELAGPFQRDPALREGLGLPAQGPGVEGLG